MKQNLDIRKVKAQSQACIYAARNILPVVLREQKPADRIIASFFKKNKKYGSRDRKIIYELIFAIFRWYGWIKKIIPEIKKLKNEPDSFPEKILYQSFLLASLFDNNSHIPDELINILLKELNIQKTFTPGKPAKSKQNIKPDLKLIKFIEKNFKKKVKLNLEDLTPKWWLNELPDSINAKQLINCFQTRPPIWLRTNTENNNYILNELTKNNINHFICQNTINAICIKESKVNIYSLESYKNGLIEIQDLASQIIGIVCDPKQNERWWDTCAGGGGKSLHLSSIMDNKGKIIATDIREYKLDDLKKRAKRAGQTNIECKKWDGKALRKNKSCKFDGVLVDAPCTCSGTWRRNPDARWRLSSTEIPEMAELQLKILKNAASGVKANGTLVYATCSIFQKENLELVKQFLSENKNFQLEPFINPLNGEKTQGYLQIYPWDADCDAMFVARFKKSNQTLIK